MEYKKEWKDGTQEKSVMRRKRRKGRMGLTRKVGEGKRSRRMRRTGKGEGEKEEDDQKMRRKEEGKRGKMERRGYTVTFPSRTTCSLGSFVSL